MSEYSKAFEALEEALLEHTGWMLRTISLNTQLRALDLDSLDVVEICILVEGKLHKDIEPPKNLSAIATVRDLIELVEKYE